MPELFAADIAERVQQLRRPDRPAAVELEERHHAAAPATRVEARPGQRRDLVGVGVWKRAPLPLDAVAAGSSTACRQAAARTSKAPLQHRRHLRQRAAQLRVRAADGEEAQLVGERVGHGDEGRPSQSKPLHKLDERPNRLVPHRWDTMWRGEAICSERHCELLETAPLENGAHLPRHSTHIARAMASQTTTTQRRILCW